MASYYDIGYSLGEFKRDMPDYDARWDFVENAKVLSPEEFAEWKRGFNEGVAS